LTSSLAIAPTADGRLVFLDRASGRPVHEMKLASAVESSPALSDRVLHVGTDDGEVVGVDVVDGTERYRVRLGRLVRSSPLPWQDRVFVGTVGDKGAGGVGSLGAARGKLLWVRKAGPGLSSPTMATSTAWTAGRERRAFRSRRAGPSSAPPSPPASASSSRPPTGRSISWTPRAASSTRYRSRARACSPRPRWTERR